MVDVVGVEPERLSTWVCNAYTDNALLRKLVKPLTRSIAKPRILQMLIPKGKCNPLCKQIR